MSKIEDKIIFISNLKNWNSCSKKSQTTIINYMNSRFLIAAADINTSPVLARRFRGKAAKELYRCGKGILLTRSVVKPAAFAISTLPIEFSQGVIYRAVGQVGETAIGYRSGIGFVRYLYKILQPAKLKATARLFDNVGCLPMTLYSKGIGGAFDLLQISKLEQIWFGEPVYIFDDNRLWIEKNFTLSDVFETIEDNG
jgi:hypothetical protein